MASHNALSESYDKLKGDHVELLQKYKALELAYEAINIDSLASLFYLIIHFVLTTLTMFF